MAKIPEVAVTVGKDKTVVMFPLSVAGKVAYDDFIYRVIDNYGTQYTNKKTGKTATYKTVHSVYSKVNAMIAKYYGFVDKNLIWALYTHLESTGKISSRPVKGGLLIAMPGSIKSTEDPNVSASNALAKMGLA